jgi:phenylpropionate dioxygenase-like ring-hydroxylating dioxygenase large terminal subunit
MTENFANPNVDTQNWYVAARSSAVRKNRIWSRPMLHRRIAFYRDAQGVAHALDARCPHLGADLGQGSIQGDQVQCAFHHWRFDAEGRCPTAPERCVRTYPVVERWGLVWLFNGPRPLFPLPDVDGDGHYRVWRPRPRCIRAHPHLVVGNGLDTRHFSALHGMQFTAEPTWRQDGEYRVTAQVEGRPRSLWLQRATGSATSKIAASFTTIGGNLAWATITSPFRFHALFTGQPAEQGGCATQVVLFLPGFLPLRAMALLFTLLRSDHRVLERLDFHPAYAAGDEPLQAMGRVVNRMPTW